MPGLCMNSTFTVRHLANCNVCLRNTSQIVTRYLQHTSRKPLPRYAPTDDATVTKLCALLVRDCNFKDDDAVLTMLSSYLAELGHEVCSQDTPLIPFVFHCSQMISFYPICTSLLQTIFEAGESLFRHDTLVFYLDFAALNCISRGLAVLIL